jgi:hypothetical protein
LNLYTINLKINVNQFGIYKHKIKIKKMKKTRVISALKAQALADKEKALMALDLLENQAVGIGDHTANDFLKDATESLQLLADAEDRLEMIEKYFNSNE